MGLWQRTESLFDECIQNWLSAANNRLYEGFELIASDYFGGGIYLLGYTGEIYLKAAYYRYAGVGLADPRIMSYVFTAETESRRYGVTFDRGRFRRPFHSICFWADLLETRRESEERPLATEISAKLRMNSELLEGNRDVILRYRPDIATQEEAEIVFESVV